MTGPRTVLIDGRETDVAAIRQRLTPLLEAIENYVEAKQELVTAQENYTGPSPGYYLWDERAALDNATDALAIALYTWKVSP